MDRLEHTARLLPGDISAYGVMSVPTPMPAAPVVNVEPQVNVHPTVQVTVETGKDSAHTQGLTDQASLTGSGSILDAPTTGEEGRKE